MLSGYQRSFTLPPPQVYISAGAFPRTVRHYRIERKYFVRKKLKKPQNNRYYNNIIELTIAAKYDYVAYYNSTRYNYTMFEQLIIYF